MPNGPRVYCGFLWVLCISCLTHRCGKKCKLSQAFLQCETLTARGHQCIVTQLASLYTLTEYDETDLKVRTRLLRSVETSLIVRRRRPTMFLRLQTEGTYFITNISLSNQKYFKSATEETRAWSLERTVLRRI